jgi:hypothetical protein
MGSAKGSKKAKALAWLQGRNPPRVEETLAFEFAAALPDVPPKTLRQALIESGLPLAPLIEGVRQDSFDHLERTLATLSAEYEHADDARRRQVRAVVITARQHADWNARNPRLEETRRVQKQEMLLWIRTWLENPPLFTAWVELRKRTHPAVAELPDSP